MIPAVPLGGHGHGILILCWENWGLVYHLTNQFFVSELKNSTKVQTKPRAYPGFVPVEIFLQAP